MNLIDVNTNWNFKETISGLLDQVFGKVNINPEINVDSVKLQISSQQIILIIGIVALTYIVLSKVKI
jgi:hypothetical protein